MAETKTELEKFYSIVESIEMAMMVTRRFDGHLRARAMANQKRAGGADLWFVTMESSAKLVDIENDPHVNMVKGFVTGEEPEFGEMHHISRQQRS